MDTHLLTIFQAELEMQCSFVAMGADVAKRKLKESDTSGVWFGLQGLLISASNASKLLWGAGPTSDATNALYAARKPLRESVGVQDSSPLNSRRIRNSFEHFDERLDKWFGKNENHVYLGRNIGPPNAVVVDGRVPNDHFGLFDPGTSILTFWEESMALTPVVLEAERIFIKLREIRYGTAS